MLVLSRKECEKIQLGNDITLTVVKVSGDKVRLGIEAPSNIKVLRNELELIDDGPQTIAHPAKLLLNSTKEALPLAS